MKFSRVSYMQKSFRRLRLCLPAVTIGEGGEGPPPPRHSIRPAHVSSKGGGGVSEGVALKPERQTRVGGLIVSLSPFSLRGSAAARSSSGPPASSALRHLALSWLLSLLLFCRAESINFSGIVFVFILLFCPLLHVVFSSSRSFSVFRVFRSRGGVVSTELSLGPAWQHFCIFPAEFK